jgi:hypothetical protein
MKYPAPRKLLNYLASHGPSAVQVEALAMLGRPDLPTAFPAFPRGSRENFLRRLAANPKKATSARLGALKELLQLMLGETPEPRSEQSAAEHPPPQPTASEAMLRALGRKHLGELSDEEYGRHSAEVSWPERLELDRQRGEWAAPDDEILDAMGLSRLTFWQGVRDRATTDDVRENATKEISKLAGSDGH